MSDLDVVRATRRRLGWAYAEVAGQLGRLLEAEPDAYLMTHFIAVDAAMAALREVDRQYRILVEEEGSDQV